MYVGVRVRSYHTMTIHAYIHTYITFVHMICMITMTIINLEDDIYFGKNKNGRMEEVIPKD